LILGYAEWDLKKNKGALKYCFPAISNLKPGADSTLPFFISDDTKYELGAVGTRAVAAGDWVDFLNVVNYRRDSDPFGGFPSDNAIFAGGITYLAGALGDTDNFKFTSQGMFDGLIEVFNQGPNRPTALKLGAENPLLKNQLPPPGPGDLPAQVANPVRIYRLNLNVVYDRLHNK
jgi:hypothetical protein